MLRDGSLYASIEECRPLCDIDVAFEGPSHGSDGATDDDLQCNTHHLANEVEQRLPVLREYHTNKRLQRPDPGRKMGVPSPSQSNAPHILTRAVVPGAPKAPTTTNGEISIALIVKAPRRHMLCKLSHKSTERMSKGLQQSKDAAATHRDKKRRSSSSSD